MPASNALTPNMVIRGPARIYLNVALPANGARASITAAGLPDPVESPNAVDLGLTREGSTFTTPFDLTREDADELTSPYRIHVSNEQAVLEGEFKELLDFDRIKYMAANAKFTSGVNFRQLSGGGLLTLTAAPIMVVAPRVDDPTKFLVIQMYSAYNAAGLRVQLNKRADNNTPFRLEALAVPGRTAGDQLWTMWYQV